MCVNLQRVHNVIATRKGKSTTKFIEEKKKGGKIARFDLERFDASRRTNNKNVERLAIRFESQQFS